MRRTPEAWLIAALSTFALTGVVAMGLDEMFRERVARLEASLAPIYAQPVDPAEYDGAAWFAKARPFCNPVDVEARMGAQPPPASHDGTMHQAACYALAGRIDRAHRLVGLLPSELGPRAADLIYDAARTAVDAGDDRAARPLLELVGLLNRQGTR